MRKEDSAQRAYLVRCWRENQSTLDGKPRWRFSVEEVLHARRRFGFDQLARLMAFLRDELARDAEEEKCTTDN